MYPLLTGTSIPATAIIQTFDKDAVIEEDCEACKL
jgi:hypothetical protein